MNEAYLSRHARICIQERYNSSSISSKRACATWKSFQNTKLQNGLSKNSISSLASAGFFYWIQNFKGKNGKWKETNILTCWFWDLDLTVSTWKLSKVLSMQKLFLQLHKVTDNVTPTRSCLFVFYITIYLRKLSSVLLLLGLIENSERTKLNWCFLFRAEVCKKCHSREEVHSQNANYCAIVFKVLLSFFCYIWQISSVLSFPVI